MTEIDSTLEKIATTAIRLLSTRGVSVEIPCSETWDLYKKHSETIEKFCVPQTTISSSMRRFLFALGQGTKSQCVVGAGTYVGFGFAWLAAGSSENGCSEQSAIALDIDGEACAIARSNFSSLIGTQVDVVEADAISWLASFQKKIDLLFIDIDDPQDGRKCKYKDILQAAKKSLLPSSIVVAHDASVPIFNNDFVLYHNYIRGDGHFLPPVVLPIDDCGISVTAFKGIGNE